MTESFRSEAIVAAFLGQYLADQAAGTPRELADYQARFPDHRQLVAAEFARLADGEDSATEAPAAPRVIGDRYELEHRLGRLAFLDRDHAVLAHSTVSRTTTMINVIGAFHRGYRMSLGVRLARLGTSAANSPR